MSTTNIIQVSLEMWGCVICAIICMISGNRAQQNGGAFKCLWFMLIASGFMLASDALAYVFRGDIRPFSIFVTRISNFLVFFSEGIIALLFVRLVEMLVSDDKQPKTHALWVKICWGCIAAQLVGLLVTPFSGFYYTFGDTNLYHRGVGIILSFVGLGIAVAISSIVLFRDRKRLSGNLWHIIRASVPIFFFCVLFQMSKYGFSLINIGITAVLIMMYMAAWMDEQARTTQREIDALEQSIAELMEMQSEKH